MNDIIRCAWSCDAGEVRDELTGSRFVCNQPRESVAHGHSAECPKDHEDWFACHGFVEPAAAPLPTADALERVALAASGPGSRRFRDLLRRERDDVAMLWGHVAQLYDYVSGGRITKGNTYPFEVIALYEEQIQRDVDQGVVERVDDLRETILSELAESPLPGARYARDVVARRFADVARQGTPS